MLPPHTYLSRPSNIINSPSSEYRVPFWGSMYTYLRRFFFNLGDFNDRTIFFKNEIHLSYLYNCEGISSQGMQIRIREVCGVHRPPQLGVRAGGSHPLPSPPRNTSNTASSMTRGSSQLLRK